MDKLTQYLNEHPHDELHPSEIANLLKDLDDKSFSEAVQAIPKELIADVALELPDRYFEDVVESFTSEELAQSGDVTDLPGKQTIISCGDGARALLSAFAYLSKKKGGN